MPGGLDAPIAQGGTNVSGGQRQRLSIARALVRKPEIYLFDDAFSALDLATDAALRAALRPHTEQSAVLVVAQRVSTILDADQIIVLENGDVVGIGTHRELMGDLPDLRRDRRVPADPGAGGMSTPTATRRPTAADPVGRRVPRHAGPGQQGRRLRPSAKRLRRPHAAGARQPSLLVVALGVVSVAFAVAGPKILGHATDIIFDGVLERMRTCRAPASTSARSPRCSRGCSGCTSRSSLFGVGAGQAAQHGGAAGGVRAARPTSRRSCTGCRCGTSTASRAASCSPASPTTSTTSRRRCSRR